MRLLSDAEIEEVVGKIHEEGIVSANAYRCVRKAGIPLPPGKIQQLATAIGVSRYRIGEAVAILEIFARHPQLQKRWDADLAAGNIGLRKALLAIRTEARDLDSKITLPPAVEHKRSRK